ncbi:hypothetical protein K438DRAFT_1983033 [Mycena galopus ATCC 62051]|nr:hypothetical protein K438DRAFT_1983033 [Mycena galopus ATCC 62051]
MPSTWGPAECVRAIIAKPATPQSPTPLLYLPQFSAESLQISYPAHLLDAPETCMPSPWGPAAERVRAITVKPATPQNPTANFELSPSILCRIGPNKLPSASPGCSGDVYAIDLGSRRRTRARDHHQACHPPKSRPTANLDVSPSLLCRITPTKLPSAPPGC